MISIELKAIVDPNNECCCEHKLAYKVKEWAFKQNYIMSSELHFKSACAALYDNNGKVLIDGRDCVIEATEPEAIFKAGEWVLEQTQKGMK